MSLFVLSACAPTAPLSNPPAPVEIRTVEVKRPAPILPPVDQLKLRPVEWIVVTPENINEKFSQINGEEVVFFALTKTGYENLALNMSDIRSNIDQYKRVIVVYKKQF